MPKLGDISKRVLVGRKLASDRLSHTLLPKRLAVPVFASDPLSSVNYATQEILVILTLGGLTYLVYTPWVAAVVVLLLVTVVASYRQLVRAYPSGGGDFEVASTNLGPTAGLVVASALLIDYVLTVAVSVSAGVDNLISAVPQLDRYRIPIALGLVVFLAAMNLRGVRESGKAFAIPAYLFVVGIGAMIVWGLGQTLFGEAPRAESADYDVAAEMTDLGGVAVMLLVLRAFASGCTALTGVETIANGVPAFRKPKGKNAASALAIMGTLSISMFVGITALAVVSEVRYVEDPCSLQGFDCETQPQRTVISQIALAVFGDESIPFYYIQAVAALILILAANTAFNGFPLLGSVLAQHRYAPRQLHTRGDKLVFSNGIIVLALLAGVLIVVFDASVTRLIQLYIVGVFTAFTLGQAGMVRHWNRTLTTTRDVSERRSIMRSRAINAFGATMTGVVLVVVTITKFTHGAWIVLATMPLLFALMRGIRRHYDTVSEELAVDDWPSESLLPSRVHAVVLVSRLHKPTVRAIAYARAARPDIIEAITVNVDADDTATLLDEWDRREIPVPLRVLDSPYREIARPVIEYVRAIRRASPRDVVTVYVPEYVVGRWWERLLHNQSVFWLKGRLLFTPGVMVTSVPWQLHSSTDQGSKGGARPGPDQGGGSS
ncbi:amino acid/polyamine/organocation transporter (APC superfamily) [Haloactinopolyspora alba]|uniref:Amino acid/polyamine/organocation transporter (APC superfamily) n=1 Tax=Haloactinopolyspora alba TaxID=648780 RepID=A0A2P8E2M7_9ACTN|nr:APC family permease [Haloactinopolyspora alba]PSL03728.1 amino acid/polyamine/organocation transporter (APC superfamily) [Haloactinopolyspora alba]